MWSLGAETGLFVSDLRMLSEMWADLGWDDNRYLFVGPLKPAMLSGQLPVQDCYSLTETSG